MAQYAMVIDVSRCIGCYNCFLACRDEHAGVDHRPVALGQPQSGQKWVDIRETERGSFPKVKLSYLPVLCQLCTERSCVETATGGAVYRRADGVVLIDPEKAVGQRAIVDACPYGVIFWNEDRNIPQKCTFCVHLLDDGWSEPRCVEVCPTRAMVFGDLSDPRSDVAKLRATAAVEALQPELGTKPLVGYLALPKRFLAGEVVLADREDTPAQGVRVCLSGGSRELDATTDNYGDFEFNDLEPRDYVMRIRHPGYQSYDHHVRLADDLNIGTIVLEPAIRSKTPSRVHSGSTTPTSRNRTESRSAAQMPPAFLESRVKAGFRRP